MNSTDNNAPDAADTRPDILFERDAGPARAEGLLAAVREDPALCRDIARMLYVDGLLLSEAAARRNRVRGDAAGRVLQMRAGQRAAPLRGAAWRWGAWGALAAAATSLRLQKQG